MVKYLVWWKEFIAENDTWKKEKDLENTKEVVAKFERRLSTKVRQQEKAETVREEDFRSRELHGRYTTKMLHG